MVFNYSVVLCGFCMRTNLSFIWFCVVIVWHICLLLKVSDVIELYAFVVSGING